MLVTVGGVLLRPERIIDHQRIVSATEVLERRSPGDPWQGIEGPARVFFTKLLAKLNLSRTFAASGTAVPK